MSILFNGINQGVLTKNFVTVLNGVPAATIMGWLNVKSFPAVSGGLIQVGTNAANNLSRINLLVLNNGGIRIGGRAPDSIGLQSAETVGGLISLNTWIHVVGQLNYATNQAFIYINGVSRTVTGSINFTASLSDNTPAYAIGIGSDELNQSEFLHSELDDLRIYGRLVRSDEIETIYATQGTDGIYQDMQVRYRPLGPEGAVLGTSTPQTIAINNPQGSQDGTNGTTHTLAYTVPSGSNLILVVMATAEGATAPTSTQPTGITFNGTPMNLRSAITATGATNDGVALYTLAVTSGQSGNIVSTYSSAGTARTLHALTLSGSQEVPEVIQTATNTSGDASTSITTIASGANVITGAISGNPNTLSTTGVGHTLQNSQTSVTSASAIGSVVPVTPSTITAGYTSSATNRMALILASFAPAVVATPERVVDLSNNEIDIFSENFPIYTAAFTKTRRNE